MNVNEFLATLNREEPPESMSAELKSLWYDKNEYWEDSHNIAQDIHTTNGSWIHAYLHRKEGDQWNADYWYTKAGKKSPALSLDEEWMELVKAML